MRLLKQSLEATMLVSGSSGQSIYRKNAGILVDIWIRLFLTLWWKVISKTWCSTTQKRQKLVTEMYHTPYSSPEPQRRSSWQKLALFFFLYKLVLNVSFVDWGARVRLNLRIPYHQKRNLRLEAVERLRSHEHSVEHIDATITFNCRCNFNHYEELIQN